MTRSASRAPIDGRGLLLVLGVPFLAAILLTPLFATLGPEPRPALEPEAKLERSSAARGPHAPRDVIEILVRDEDGAEHRGRHRIDRDGRRFEDLIASIRRVAPGCDPGLRDGRITAARGRLSLADAPGNRGRLDFDRVAYDRRRANRRIRKPAHYLLLGGFWLTGWLVLRRRRRDAFRAAGLRPVSARAWLSGFGLGAGTLGLALVLAVVVGKRVLDFEGPGPLLGAAAAYAPLALAIGLLEDVAFFGFLGAILGGRRGPTALVFAITHFLHADADRLYEAETWALGLEAMGAALEALKDIPARGGEFLGLVIVGACLADLRRVSGGLWFGMGLHGGWYWARALGRKVCDDRPTDWDWFAGTGVFYDGFFGWLALAATWALGRRLMRARMPGRENPHGIDFERES